MFAEFNFNNFENVPMIALFFNLFKEFVYKLNVKCTKNEIFWTLNRFCEVILNKKKTE